VTTAWLVLLRLGVRSLKLHKLRSSLSILGVVFGVAAVVAMSSVGEGARRETLAQIASLGIDTVTSSPEEPGSKTPRSSRRGGLGRARGAACERWRRCGWPSFRRKRGAGPRP
jgi:ABC-type lipoprotein release transport system permease subunit